MLFKTNELEFVKFKESRLLTSGVINSKPFNNLDKFVHNKQLITNVYISNCVKFSYEMAFSKEGSKHREHRSGGSYMRTPFNIFIDTLRGKIAECVFYLSQEKTKGLLLTESEFGVWDRGVWDNFDFKTNDGIVIQVKSTKHFGKYLLIESQHLKVDVDYFAMVKIKFNDTKVKAMINNEDSLDNVVDFLIEDIGVQFLGLLSKGDYDLIISNQTGERLLKKGDYISEKMKMDADNFYVLISDFNIRENLLERKSKIEEQLVSKHKFSLKERNNRWLDICKSHK